LAGAASAAGICRSAFKGIIVASAFVSKTASAQRASQGINISDYSYLCHGLSQGKMQSYTGVLPCT
jgi:hypothetical protein